MITFTQGNILDSTADCLVNTVNCEGYMGKGIAYQFKMRYPENNRGYVKACKSKALQIGELYSCAENGKIIINFPTKDRWREPSKLEFIERGLVKLVQYIATLAVKSIAIPPLGCGNGGLAWTEVKSIVLKYIEPLQEKYDFIIYEPVVGGYNPVIKEAPKLFLSGLILIDIARHLKRFNNIRLQKAAYLTNYLSGRQYFKFGRGLHGPYDHGVDIVAKHIKEYKSYYNIKSYDDLFNHAYQTICSKKVDEGYACFKDHIVHACNMLNTISKDKDMEGVLTALYLIDAENIRTKEQVVEGFQTWSPEKASKFPRKDVLEDIQWLLDNKLVVTNIFGELEKICHNS